MPMIVLVAIYKITVHMGVNILLLKGLMLINRIIYVNI